MGWNTLGHWLGAALVSGACTSCAGGLQARATSPDAWLRLDTPHFSLSTNLAPANAERIARTLEDTRASLLALAWVGARDPRGRTQVVAFARPSEFEHFVDQPTLAGIAVSRPLEERTIAFRPGAEGDVPEVVVHELAHDLSQWFMPLQPPWFAEGLAVYLQNVKLDPDTRRAAMGEVSGSSAKWLGETHVLIRASKLFAAETSHNQDPAETASFYASSWLLVHYLLNQEPEAFGRFQLALTRLTPWSQAWHEAFPALKLEELDERVIAYAKQLPSGDPKVAQVLSDKVIVPAFEIQQRRLTAAEAHGVLARLSSSVGAPAGELEMRAALDLDPSELNALVAQFRALPADADRARAGIAQQATRAHPESAEAWLLAALVAPPGDARHAALEQARRLSPDHPGVTQLLGEEDVQRGRMQAALDHTWLALRRSPPSPTLLSLRVVALASRQQCEAARTLTSNADYLFPADCSASVAGQSQPVPCGESVRDAWNQVRGRCTDGQARLAP